MFPSHEFHVLSAICDTFIPSLPHGGSSRNASFFALSASEAGVPSEVELHLNAYMRPSHMRLMRLVLRLLSTKLGTLHLGGWYSFTRTFPFIHDFPSLPLHNRERIMQNWSFSSYLSFQQMFKVFKCYSLRSFYNKPDYLRIWNAIDYYIPDPDEQPSASVNQSVLKRRIIDLNLEKDLSTAFRNMGHSGLDGSCQFDDQSSMSLCCDAIVIGSGSGGGVAAAILAEAGYKVIIIEKGSYFPPQDLSLSEGIAAQTMYEGGAYLTTYDGGVLLMAGSTVGGGSAVNWSASFKTPKHVLNEWAEEHKLSFFVGEKFCQSMDKVVQRLMVQENVDEESFSNSVLRKGCKVLNYHVGNVPRNSSSDHYCGWCGFGCRSSKKMSTAETWLVDAVKAGAIILINCEAEQIHHTQKSTENEGKLRRVEGLIASATDKSRKLNIQAKVVVVACGALCTPPLLRRSGLANPNIGKNLHIHPVALAWGYFPDKCGAPGRSYEGGIMTAFSKVAANWESSGYGPLLMVPSMHPGGFAAMMPWVSGEESKRRMQGFSRIAHIISVTRDQDGGSVSTDNDGRLKVDYKISSHDRKNCLDGVEHALRILVAAGAAEVGTHNNDGESYKVDPADSAAELLKGEGFRQFIKRFRSKALKGLNTSLVSAHQMGSCRMGVTPSTSAVDPKGETWEIDGLFVADSSVFPTSTGVNPMVTVQSIAYHTTLECILPYLQARSF